MQKYYRRPWWGSAGLAWDALLRTRLISFKLISLVSVFVLSFGNIRFFKEVLEVYPLNWANSTFLLSLSVVFACVNIILFTLLCHKYTIKPVLIIFLLVSSLSAYFMDTYRVIINDDMIDSVLKTDVNEFLDLVSPRQFLYFIFLGLFPSAFVYKANIVHDALKTSVISKMKVLGVSIGIVLAIVLVFGDFYASFLREHKVLRSYANPSYALYSAVKYTGRFWGDGSRVLKVIGEDAQILPSDARRELVVFVVGETVRSDHLSLNGYGKKTNPYLEKEGVISFKNVWACGTSTAHAVPCMFSKYGRSDYSSNKATTTENVLDVLKRAGVNVRWLDNNSDSKGVAERVPYESYKTPGKNAICDIECRDEGMLLNLQNYIDAHPQGDIFIVLHQMGNHGPAYYKRYPPAFEKFRPACKTNQLEHCSIEEISNAYDNAILYTDYFLSQTIQLLKKNDGQFETALLYVSDHGESLGENNLYLHGLPYWIAPDAQKHVPLVMWFGEHFDKDELNLSALRRKEDNPLSHDYIFHTILGLMEVQTSIYDPSLDLIERAARDGAVPAKAFTFSMAYRE